MPTPRPPAPSSEPIELKPVDGVYQPTAAPRRPPARADTLFLLRHPAHALALGFGSGLSPVAPGTVGTLWAWWSFHWLTLWLTPWQMGALIAASVPLGVWACKLTAEHLGQSDPSAIVWDEIVAFWLILWLVTPASGWTQFAAFGLFRLLDAAKPGPVRWADRVFKGGGWRGAFGIVWDDLVAALCALVLIALWRF